MKKQSILLIVVSFVFMLNVLLLHTQSTCYAAVPASYEFEIQVPNSVTQDASYLYSTKDMVDYYVSNSLKYKEDKYKRKMDVVSGKLALKDYTDLNTSLNEITNSIAELQKMKDTQIEYRDELLKQHSEDKTEEIMLQINTMNQKIQSIESQITQYNESYATVDTSSTSLKLQKNIYAFYEENEASIDRESEYLLKYNFLKEFYQLILMKEKLVYYNDLKASYDLLYKAEKIKKSYGFSDELTLGLAEAKVIDGDNSASKYEADYLQAYETIMDELSLEKNGKVKLEIEFGKKEYNADVLKQYFLTTNMTLINLRNLEKSYMGYASGFETGSANWEKGYYTSLNYGYKANLYEKEIRQYVDNMLNNYDYYFKLYETSKKQVVACETKLEILNKKLSYKRATKIEISQATYALDEAKVKYYQYAFNVKLMEYLFDYYIYGVNVI